MPPSWRIGSASPTSDRVYSRECCQQETDVDDKGHHPGQRYRTAGLVLPALNIQHTNGLVLEFDSLEAVDATMDYLMKVRGLLLETLTEEDIQQDDEADRF